MKSKRAIIFAVVAVLATIALVVPPLALHVSLLGARRCFAALEVVYGAEEPVDCRAAGRWLWLAEWAPWTQRDVARLREELGTRWAASSYLDAAIGLLDSEKLEQRYGALKSAAFEVANGTGRQRLDELGPVMPTPAPGALAHRVGDRQALIAHGLSFNQHFTEKHAVRAALLEGNLARAVRLGKHYQGRPNSDLRVMVAALLCLGGDYQLGMDQIVEVERSRAEKRTANFSRNFGAARVVIEACATLGGLDAPLIPPYGHAGSWDHRTQLLALRMRKLRAQHPCDWAGEEGLKCLERREVRDHVEHLRRSLSDGTDLRYRLEMVTLVAELLRDPLEASRLALPRKQEPGLRARTPVLYDSWIASPTAEQPFVSAERFSAAAKQIDALAKQEPTQPKLVQLAGVMWLRSAMGWAARGKADRAREAAKRGAGLALDRVEGLVALASLELVLGERERGLKLLRAGALKGATTAEQRFGAAAFELQRAVLQLPDRKGAKPHAVRCRDRAKRHGHLTLEERASWLLLAMGHVEPAWSQAAQSRPRVARLGPPTRLIEASVRRRQLEARLGQWRKWIAAPAPAKRATRWHSWRHRGDAPAATGAFMLAASQLVDRPSAERVERWLDALMSFDAGTLKLRSYAFARHLAASWRNYPEKAVQWRLRFEQLAELAQDPGRAELIQQLGI